MCIAWMGYYEMRFRKKMAHVNPLIVMVVYRLDAFKDFFSKEDNAAPRSRIAIRKKNLLSFMNLKDLIRVNEMQQFFD